VSEIDVATARTQVRVARAMRQFPALDQAMASGDVSYAKARVLAAYLSPANVDDLLAIAETTPAGRLGAAIAAWSQRNDNPDTIRRRQHEARSVTWRTEPDGMVVLTARLTPDTAGAVCAAIDTSVTRNHAPAGAPLTHQRADALVALVTDGGGSVTAELVVHVNAEGNTLTDGTPLSDHAVASLLPYSFVSLLLHDNQGRPIDASPPTPTPHPPPTTRPRPDRPRMPPTRLPRHHLPPVRPHPALHPGRTHRAHQPPTPLRSPQPGPYRRRPMTMTDTTMTDTTMTELSFTLMPEVKKRRRGATRVSSKHQVTIPVDALRAAGVEVGDRLVARADGPGRIVFEREADVVADLAGALTGAFEPGELNELREEWG
jgi:bifunctional DNA-binding transcriptional regulator/antitoxin component of YhaV-PrlF toxin-antitoxin module